MSRIITSPFRSNNYILNAVVGECYTEDYLTVSVAMQWVQHQREVAHRGRTHKRPSIHSTSSAVLHKSLRNCFFGTGGVFALINVKVMHFIRFVRVKLFTKGINYICFAGRCPGRDVICASAGWLVVLLVAGDGGKGREAVAPPRLTSFCNLIDVHNVICSHQRVRWTMAGHLLGEERRARMRRRWPREQERYSK